MIRCTTTNLIRLTEEPLPMSVDAAKNHLSQSSSNQSTHDYHGQHDCRFACHGTLKHDKLTSRGYPPKPMVPEVAPGSSRDRGINDIFNGQKIGWSYFWPSLDACDTGIHRVMQV